MAGVAYDPRSYDPGSYDTGGLAVSIVVSSGDRAARVWALQLELASGFPVSYPRPFDAVPLRLSSLDLTPDGTDLGSNFYEARLLETPVVVSSSSGSATAATLLAPAVSVQASGLLTALTARSSVAAAARVTERTSAP